MRDHSFAKGERVRSDVFWGEPKSGCANPSGLGPEDRDDVPGAGRVDPFVGVRLVADRGVPWAPIFAHAEEDGDAHSNQAGWCQLRSEERERFPYNFILLVFQSEDDLG